MPSVIQNYLGHFHRWQERLWLKRSFQRFPDALEFDSTSLTALWVTKDRHCEFRRETVQWSDVSEIWVYKKDCFSVDQIRMLFRTKDLLIEITEDMSGWQALVDHLPSVLPGSTAWADWYTRVVQPPFAPNITKIYERNEKR